MFAHGGAPWAAGFVSYMRIYIHGVFTLWALIYRIGELRSLVQTSCDAGGFACFEGFMALEV